MKVAGLLVAVAAVLGVALLGCLSLRSAHAQQATPGPDVPPAGEFKVTPSSGPVGTLVTLSGSFDQPISYVEFRCVYRGEPYETLETAHSLPEPAARSFSFEYTIPADLPIRQGGGATYPISPGAECSFHAISWHRLLSASVPFAVTAPDLPGVGTTAQFGDRVPLLAFAGLAGLGVMAFAAGYAVRSRTGG